MLIKYKKLTVTGALIEGTADYDSLEDAKNQLINQGELLLELKLLKSKQEFKLNSSELFEFTYQMHQLIAAGLPIYESLLSLKEKKVKYSDLIDKIAGKIKEGLSLSKTLASYPLCFDTLYLAIIQASEASGEIKEGFNSLKNLLEKRAKILKILKSAFVYPSILLTFAVIIVLALIFFIIPSLKELFEGREVASLTKMILEVSNFFNAHIIEFFLFQILLVGGVCYSYITGRLKKLVLNIFSYIPFCQTLTLSLKLENFFFCLSLLLKRGINLKDALVLTKTVLQHEQLEQNVTSIINNVLMGKKFSDAISHPFPYVAKRMVALAEETGRLSENCEMLALLFQEDVEKKLSQLASFLQPALLAFIGLIVGLVVLSILLPLTDVGGFI